MRHLSTTSIHTKQKYDLAFVLGMARFPGHVYIGANMWACPLVG